MKLLVVVGARPNFIKIAPIVAEARRRPNLDIFIVHTGQHYDRQMSELFFEELNIPSPHADLGVGSGTHAVQTAEVMKRFEPVLDAQHPDVVLVVGDVNSTLACALTAAKLNIPVAHVEAGLRSFDRTMPEEINRILTDALSRWLFVTEPSGVENLQREGISPDRIFFVGNVMIDTLLSNRQRIDQSPVLADLRLREQEYAVLTLHRPANVDEPRVFRKLLDALDRIAAEIPIIFPVHPRTRAAIDRHPPIRQLRCVDPMGYVDFMELVSHARFVLTDSGGIQEEATVLGVTCLTLRENTERPITVTEGTNILVGLDPEKIFSAAMSALSAPKKGRVPALWDGQAARRIIDILSHSPLSRHTV